MKNAKATVLILIALISGCVVSPERARADEMYIKAAELRKLSAAVESTVRYKNPSPTLSDDELLKLATAANPALLAVFSGYTLRVDRRDKHAVVLVCTPTGETALLEDAACTGQLDAHHWKADKPLPCDFTIQAAVVC
jgi:hypothetical protein